MNKCFTTATSVVLTTDTMYIPAFWVVPLYQFMDIYQSFRAVYWCTQVYTSNPLLSLYL